MNALSIIVCAVYIVIGIIAWKRTHAAEQSEQEDDYCYLTVREKMSEAKKTSDAIGTMEQLETDIAESTADDVLIVRLVWLSRDGQNMEYELYLDGANLASDHITEIASRESHQLRKLLAYQVDSLQKSTRSAKNSVQNDDMTEGDDESAETLSEVWPYDVYR